MPWGEHRVQCHHCGVWFTCGDCIVFTCHDCDRAGHRGLFIDCPKCEEETRARREERTKRAREVAPPGVERAAHDLGVHLGRPSWLSAIGVGSEDGKPAIIVFLVFEPRTEVPVLRDGVWQGYPIVTRVFGEFAPLGPSS